MEPAIVVAIGALIVSFLNSAFTAKTYKKNRRLEFLQRRDHLSQKISDLNDRNTEAYLISARYALVAARNAGLPLQGEQAERNTALIASISQQQEGVEKGMRLWDANIEKLHFIYSHLESEADGVEVERLIAIVQVASDNRKKAHNGYSSVLHILETTNEMVKANVAESDAKIRQINLDTDEKIRQINLEFAREMETLEKEWRLSDGRGVKEGDA
jgi:hypothetical protein